MDKLKAITVFLEVADKGNMSAAASSLGMVNSAVSKNLKQLEDWLGQKLFYRSTRSMTLTDSGIQYLAQCREIKTNIDYLETMNVASATELSGKILITAGQFLGRSKIAPILAEFKHLHPKIDLRLNISDKPMNLIDDGVDLAVRVSQMPDSGMYSRVLQKMVLKVVASPDYLKNKDIPTDPNDLSKYDCILEGENIEGKRWRMRGSDSSQFSVSVKGSIQADCGECIRTYCRSGLGIAQLPSFFVEDDLQNNRLVELFPEYALDNFYIHLLYCNGAIQRPCVSALIEFITEKFH